MIIDITKFYSSISVSMTVTFMGRVEIVQAFGVKWHEVGNRIR